MSTQIPHSGVSLVDLATRRDCYRTGQGVWLADRRNTADRRADRIVELHIRGMRNKIRRRSDLEMWEYLTESEAQVLPDVRHVRQTAN